MGLNQTQGHSCPFLERPEESGAAGSQLRLGRSHEIGPHQRPECHCSDEQLQYYHSSAPLLGTLRCHVKALIITETGYAEEPRDSACVDWPVSLLRSGHARTPKPSRFR